LQKPRTAQLFRSRRIALLAVCSDVESQVEEPVRRERAQRSGRRPPPLSRSESNRA